MTPELAHFSDWVLAILPRLFIYPGGLWLFGGVLLVRLAGGGVKTIKPTVWLADLSGAGLLSSALAWGTVALLPLPGASALPSPVDRWALAALLALSLLWGADLRSTRGLNVAQVGAAITLAVLAPLAGSDWLIALPADYLSRDPVAFGLALAAVIMGLAVIAWLGGSGLAGQMRGVAWLALALAPIYGDMWTGATIWIFGVAVVVWLSAGRFGRDRPMKGDLAGWATAILWLPACLALAALLLAVL